MRGHSSWLILYLVFLIELFICSTFPVISFDPFGPVSAFSGDLFTHIVVVVTVITVVVVASVPIVITTVEGHGC